MSRPWTPFVAMAVVMPATLLALAPLRGRADAIEIPARLDRQISDLRAQWSRKEVNNAGSGELADGIYRWIVESFNEHSGQELVAALGRVLPVITDEPQRVWDRKRAERTDAPISLAAAHWQSGDRELLVARVDRVYQSGALALRSRTPLFLARTRNQVVVATPLKDSEGSEDCETVCSFHGFLVRHTGDSVPDVVLSSGPKGQASVVEIMQLHLEGKTWNEVWEAPYAWANQIEVDTRTGQLAVSATGAGLPSGKTGTLRQVWQLQPGVKAQLIK